jgi:uncharacterized protein DUF4384
MIAGLNFIPFIFCLSALVQPQSARQLERDIVPEQFIKARPSKPGDARTRRIRYRNINSKSTARSQSSPGTQLGLTIWRLRPAAVAQIGERIIVQEDGEIDEWIPERVAAGRPLRIGEKIRLSFESQQVGYLYVVDREQYADGTFGEPFLIFPTTHTRNGENRVAAGRLIEIPAQEDHPNFFTMRRSRLDQTGEELIVLITPQPLADLTIGATPLRLTDEMVQKWEQSWGAKTEQFEMANGSEKTWTRIEQETGRDADRRLTQSDPGPQTIFRVALGPDEPRLIKVRLRYIPPKPRARKFQMSR